MRDLWIEVLIDHLHHFAGSAEALDVRIHLRPQRGDQLRWIIFVHALNIAAQGDEFCAPRP